MTVGTVVLAAGRGARLGGVAKATLRLGGRTLLELVAGNAVGSIVVVAAAPFVDEVAAEARRLGLVSVVNPDPARGMASSFACGLDALGDVDVALAWPVDQPLVRRETVSAIVAIAAPVVVPTFHGRGGHPTGFARALFADCRAAVHAPDGLRSVLARHAVTRLPVDDPGVVADVDTPADWEKMKLDAARWMP